MQIEIRDDYDREAVAAILRALDPEAIMRGASTSGIVHREVKVRGRRMIDAIREELLAGIAAADALAHSRRAVTAGWRQPELASRLRRRHASGLEAWLNRRAGFHLGGHARWTDPDAMTRDLRPLDRAVAVRCCDWP